MSGRRMEADLDEAALEAWAERAGRSAADRGVVVALCGPLGAGKTTFVRAALRGAGAERAARSPTYTLHHPHGLRGGGRVHHLDLYRIADPAELDDLGWEDLAASGEAVFVEWAGRAGDRLPADRWEVELAMTAAGERRRLRARALGGAPDLPDPPGAREPAGAPASMSARKPGGAGETDAC